MDFSFAASSDNLGVAGTIVMFVGGIVMLILSGWIAAAYTSGLLDIANGQPVTIGSFFKPRNVTNVVLATVIVGAITFAVNFVLQLPTCLRARALVPHHAAGLHRRCNPGCSVPVHDGGLQWTAISRRVDAVKAQASNS